MSGVDLAKPSVDAARILARRVADKDGIEAGTREFLKLLWAVPYRNGGFCHGDDKQVGQRAARMGFSRALVREIGAMPGNGIWPREMADAA